MEYKPNIDSVLNNLARITCISITFIVFGIITYRSPMDSNIFGGLSIFAKQLFLVIFRFIAISLILRYSFKKENKVIREDRKKLKVNIFDILIFLFIGLTLANILLLGLHYIEIITNTVPEYNNDVTRVLLEGLEVTKLDRIYNFMTVVILVPTVEELFFRKGVFKYYEDKGVKSGTIILISGISFGLNHLMGLAIPASAMIKGITFAILYAITDNVIYPIIGHGLNNWSSSIAGLYSSINILEYARAYFEHDSMIEIIEVIIFCLILLIITSIISYIKRNSIISSDFKDQLRKVLTE